MSDLVHSFTGLLTAFLIPCVAIIGGLSYAAYSMYLKTRRQRETLQMYHAERMAAIEKGIELPPLPPEILHEKYDGNLYRGEHRRWRRSSGLTLVLVGAAITIAMWQSNGDSSYWWGLVIVAWGLGRVVSEWLDGGRESPGAAPRPGTNDPTHPG